ncbi:tail fiber protein [Variovorax paradoxus]|nr:tail fiber protein [Variovorax paradoxus]
MAIVTTLAACNVNPALNGPDGATDLPSTLDDAIRFLCSFVAQLRDGAGIRTGAVLPFPIATAPLGFLKLNGALISRTTYADLFAFATSSGLVSEATWAAGSSGLFSVGDGSTTFRLPDARGTFFRGLDESRGLDIGRALGVYQDHANVVHAHSVSDPTHAHGVSDPGHIHGASSDAQGNHQHTYVGPGDILLGAGAGFNVANQNITRATDAAGNHAHNITVNLNGSNIAIFGAGTGISIQNQGSADGHPRNLAYPFYIKY